MITTASFSTASAYLADVTPPEGRAKAYGLIGAAWSAGFVAGPLLGGFLGEWSPRAPFWAAGALSAIAADPLALVLLKEPGAMGAAGMGADIVLGSAQRFGC